MCSARRRRGARAGGGGGGGGGGAGEKVGEGGHGSDLHLKCGYIIGSFFKNHRQGLFPATGD